MRAFACRTQVGSIRQSGRESDYTGFFLRSLYAERPLQNGKDSSVTDADSLSTVYVHPYLEPLRLGRPFGTGISRAHIFTGILLQSMDLRVMFQRQSKTAKEGKDKKVRRSRAYFILVPLSLSPFSLRME